MIDGSGSRSDAFLAPIWSGWDVVLVVAGAAALTVSGTLVLFFVFEDGIADLAVGVTPSLPLSLAALFLNVFGFALPPFLIGLWRRVDWSNLGWRPLSSLWWRRAAAAGLATIFLTNIVALLVILLLGEPLENPQIDFVVPEGFSWSGLIGMTLLAGIFVPFAEEFLFRGVIFRWMRQHTGFRTAAILSSAIFGLFHGVPAVIAGAFVLGLISAWVYERSGSLWGAVVVHVLNNGVKVLLLYVSLYP